MTWRAWRERRKLERELTVRRDELRAGEVSLLGSRLSRSSELVQFEVCVSMFLLYARFRTSYFPKDQERPTRILATVLVFLFGWWSLSGPFVTVQSLVVNLRGGHRMTVQELLNQLPASP